MIYVEQIVGNRASLPAASRLHPATSGSYNDAGSKSSEGKTSMAEYDLPRRRLGRTEMVVTRLSFGGTGIGGVRTTDDDAVSAATVRAAWDGGINYVDTAPLYGESERRIGIALKEMGGRPPGMLLSTKCRLLLSPDGRFSPEETRASVLRSLARLGVESVDLLFVHSPSSIETVLRPGGMLDELNRMREEGWFRWIGLGGRNHDMHRQAIRSGRFDAILTYADYNLVRQTAAPLIEEAAGSGVGVVLAQAYLFGILAGPEPRLEQYAGSQKIATEYLVPDVAPGHDWWVWARDRGVSLRAVALQYCLRNPYVDVLLAGADSPEQAQQNLEASREQIPDEIWDEVDTRVSARSG